MQVIARKCFANLGDINDQDPTLVGESIDLVSLLIDVASDICENDRTGSTKNEMKEFILNDDDLIVLLMGAQKAKNSAIHRNVLVLIDELSINN